MCVAFLFCIKDTVLHHTPSGSYYLSVPLPECLLILSCRNFIAHISTGIVRPTISCYLHFDQLHIDVTYLMHEETFDYVKATPLCGYRISI